MSSVSVNTFGQVLGMIRSREPFNLHRSADMCLKAYTDVLRISELGFTHNVCK